jgi:hypothetical protein
VFSEFQIICFFFGSCCFKFLDVFYFFTAFIVSLPFPDSDSKEELKDEHFFISESESSLLSLFALFRCLANYASLPDELSRLGLPGSLYPGNPLIFTLALINSTSALFFSETVGT